MKFFLTLTLLFVIQFSMSQNIRRLEQLSNTDQTIENKAIIYGTFIQRLGLSSGGFPQDIQLRNLETEEIVSFRVKPTFKSAKQNTFIVYIEPGNYEILNYYWTKSMWYGGKTYTEPIFKAIDGFELIKKKDQSTDLSLAKFERYQFTLQADTLYYVGTWHFDQGIVSFTNDKETIDLTLSAHHRFLSFLKAITVLPK